MSDQMFPSSNQNQNNFQQNPQNGVGHQPQQQQGGQQPIQQQQQQQQQHQHQQQQQQQPSTWPGLTDEASRKFSSMLTMLRTKVQQFGPESQEGQAANEQISKIMTHLALLKKQQEEQHAQRQQQAQQLLAAQHQAQQAAQRQQAAQQAQQQQNQQQNQLNAQQGQNQQANPQVAQARQAYSNALAAATAAAASGGNPQGINQHPGQEGVGQPGQANANQNSQAQKQNDLDLFKAARARLAVISQQVPSIQNQLKKPGLSEQDAVALKGQLDTLQKQYRRYESVVHSILQKHGKSSAGLQGAAGVPGLQPNAGQVQPGLQPQNQQARPQGVATPQMQRQPSAQSAQHQALMAASGAGQASPQPNPANLPSRQNTMSPAINTAMAKQPSQQGIAARPLQAQNGVPGSQAGKSPAPTTSSIPTPTVPATTQSPIPRPSISTPTGQNPQQLASSRPGTAQGQMQRQPSLAGGAASPTNPLPTANTQPPLTPIKPEYSTGQRDYVSSNRHPIPSTLQPPTLTPVPIPAARPTLSGGPNAPAYHIMGTPAVAKAPGFDQEDTISGLTSKRKLDELMREIDPTARLDAEVEELVYDLVNGFVDQVTVQACKMAKHRNSEMLEIKDVQLILERNWNIRIPGYQGDEIRTVRKFHPTQAHTTKVAQVNQGKALNATMGKDE